MQVVLGIDAAWTSGNPSGFAVAVNSGTGWQLRLSAESWSVFKAAASGSLENKGPSLPSASDLLAATQAIAGAEPDVIAVDMPLAKSPIVARRFSDNEVSRVYGSRHAGTHTPSETRPGRISDDLRAGFEALGFPLRTDSFLLPALIEVYPHPALIELTGADRRLPYKIGKIRSYWREKNAQERRAILVSVWQNIETALERQLAGVKSALPLVDSQSSTMRLKAYEDALDAVICAWVGICALEGRALPYGDDASAIWIPRSVV